ncbi:MAG TPA: NAD(P)H-hydrate dehydratase [Gemmatimonadaceae bacterium]|nr:NAD(P)H-hydrate dehydratase [Gemmatimonadaceae bacterium]
MSAIVRVTTAAEAAARDADAIGGGVPSRALMQRAGAAAAGEIARRLGALLARGVHLYAGPGNNGGDAWVVARALATAGVPVRVTAVGESRTPDCRAERALAARLLDPHRELAAAVVVDGLLGTGAHGTPHGEIAEAIHAIARAKEMGATVVALDVPSGLDASTGDAALAVEADLTITFGTLKRGLLVARHLAGRIIVVDIGLDDDATTAGHDAPILMSSYWLRLALPPIPAAAHKGVRGKLAIVGGAPGMAGAAVLAARAAARSGIGMVRLLVPPGSLAAVQSAAPHALATPWPELRRARSTPMHALGADVRNAEDDDEIEGISGWADAVCLGPGLGRSPETRALVEHVLARWEGPVLLDADALNVFAGEASALGRALSAGSDARPALLTPHAPELARLWGGSPGEVDARRFDVGAELAESTGAAVLLKGVPTVVTGVDGERFVVAAGTPALAAAGSGDMLSGIAATLLAQGVPAVDAGACAAWAHGRAAELACVEHGVRGITLQDVEDRLRDAWSAGVEPDVIYPVLAELPAVAGG